MLETLALPLMAGYAAALLLWAWRTAGRHVAPEAFFVNNRSTSATGVALSIVASCVGGSSTLGMAGLAWKVGTPALWWLGSGVVGLVILGVFLAGKVRETRAGTMPELVGASLGSSLRPLVSVIIVAAWMSILAAQFTALGTIAGSFVGMNPATMLLPGALFIVLYSVLGGQAAVMRGDAVHLFFMAGMLLLALAALLFYNGDALRIVPLEMLSPEFPLERIMYFMVVMGGSYVVCPMLFGRLLSARGCLSARRGALWGAAGLLLMAVVIVTLGILSRGLVPVDTPADQVLVTVFRERLPAWVSMLMLLGLFSAVLSSADSCLVTAATVLSSDLLHLPSTRACRWCMLALGCGGVLIAGSGRGVLSFLLMANDIYVCGVVAPVFVGLVLQGRFVLHERLAALAVCVGGTFGLVAAVTGDAVFTYAGVASGLLLSLCAARRLSLVPAGV